MARIEQERIEEENRLKKEAEDKLLAEKKREEKKIDKIKKEKEAEDKKKLRNRDIVVQSILSSNSDEATTI